MAKNNTNTDTRASQIKRAASKVSVSKANTISQASLLAGTSRKAVADAFLSLLGKTDATSIDYAARYSVAKRAVIIGAVAGSFKRKGDNRTDDELLAYASEVVSSAKPDAAKLSTGQRHCTDAEWKARRAAATFLSTLCGEYGINPPKELGGTARGAGKAKAKATPEAVVAKLGEASQDAVKKLIAKARSETRKADAEALAYVPPAKASDAKAFGAYATNMAVTLALRLDKVQAASKGGVSPAVSTAIAAFRDAMRAATGE